MKKVGVIAGLIVLSVVALPSFVSAQCESDSVIVVPAEGVIPELARLAAIRTALENYTDYYRVADGEYRVVFDIEGDDPVPFDEPLTLTHVRTQPLVICGLDISKDAAYVSDAPLLSITAIKGKVILRDSRFVGAEKALAMTAGGTPHEIHTSQFECINGGTCVDIASWRTLLDGVTVSGGDVGVYVNADGVKIQNSTIRENGIGVRVASTRRWTELDHNLIFANNDSLEETLDRVDAVKFDDGCRDFRIFDEVSDSEITQVSQDGEPYEFQGTAHIVVPTARRTDTKVEFYTVDAASCGLAAGTPPRNQGCGYISSASLPRDTLRVGTASLDLGLSDTTRDDFLVATVTVDYQTTCLSRALKLHAGAGFEDEVVLVATADPIPVITNPGATGGATGGSGDTTGSTTGSGDDFTAYDTFTGTDDLGSAIDVDPLIDPASGRRSDSAGGSDGIVATVNTDDAGAAPSGCGGGNTIVPHGTPPRLIDILAATWWILTILVATRCVRQRVLSRRRIGK